MCLAGLLFYKKTSNPSCWRLVERDNRRVRPGRPWFYSDPRRVTPQLCNYITSLWLESADFVLRNAVSDVSLSRSYTDRPRIGQRWPVTWHQLPPSRIQLERFWR
jgi:hypothetical protein